MNSSTKKVLIVIAAALSLLCIYFVCRTVMIDKNDNSKEQLVITPSAIGEGGAVTGGSINTPQVPVDNKNPKVSTSPLPKESKEPSSVKPQMSATPKTTIKPSGAKNTHTPKPMTKKPVVVTTTTPTVAPTNVPEKVKQCTLKVSCLTILSNMNLLAEDKHGLVPKNGLILSEDNITFSEGETVLSMARRICRDKGIPFDADVSGYVRGINNLYEFDCGSKSGWNYRVNGKFPSLGCGNYYIKAGDVIEFMYTCNLGKDLM